MTTMQQPATFSIAVALPAYRKTLVERMLTALSRDAAPSGISWTLSDPAHADVTLRLDGDDFTEAAPNLIADVRRRDGNVDVVRIESPWRTGALLSALQRIAGTLAPAAADQSEVAWQFLRRWCDMAADPNVRMLRLRIGGRDVALLDPQHSYWHALEGSTTAQPDVVLDAMASRGWQLDADTQLPTVAPRPLKPLLWKFGEHAGAFGLLGGIAMRGGLRLKGWPYLAAGGHKAYATLILALRSGDNALIALQSAALAPAAVVNGFLNACYVCDFFHIDTTRQSDNVAILPRPAAANAVPSRTSTVISSIRRSLGGPAA